MGKALDTLSAHQPPPAPLADFVPYQPIPGKKTQPLPSFALQYGPQEYRLPRKWPVSVVPLSRERAAPVRLLEPHPPAVRAFGDRHQPWLAAVSLCRPRMEIAAEDPLPALAQIAGDDSEPAGPEPLEISAADRQAASSAWSDPAWSQLAVRLPDQTPAPVSRSPLDVGGPAGSLQPEPVEAFLPLAPEPQIAGWPQPAVTDSHWTLHAAEWEILGSLADPAAAPGPAAVESLLPDTAQPETVRWPVRRPNLFAGRIPDAGPLESAGPAPSPAAEAAESFLPTFAEIRMVGWPAHRPVAMPARIANCTPFELAPPARSPAAEAVEAFLPAHVPLCALAWPVKPALPAPLHAVIWTLAADLAAPAQPPSAEAVEAFLPLPAEPQIAAFPARAASLPVYAFNPADWVIAAGLAAPAKAPAAEPVESFLPTATAAGAIAVAPALRMPDLALAAAEPEPLEDFVPPLVVAPPSECFAPGLPACEVACEVTLALHGMLPPAASLAAPAGFVLEEPAVRWAGGWRPPAAPEPVSAFVAPRVGAALAPTFAVSLPDLRTLRSRGRRAERLASPAAPPLPNAAQPVEAQAAEEQADPWRQVIRFPALDVRQATGNRTAPFQPGRPAIAEPASAGPNFHLAPSPADPAAAVQPPPAPSLELTCGLKPAGPAVTDFICQRTPMGPIDAVERIAPRIPVQAPKFAVRPVFERVEAAQPSKPAPKPPAFTEIFDIRKAARTTTVYRTRLNGGGLFSVGKAVAAALLVGIGIWFGVGSVKISREMLAINTSIRNIGSGYSVTPPIGYPKAGPELPAPRSGAPGWPESAIASVRHVIQNRAALELTDTFKRMEAWGSGAMTIPAGWVRHPNGYVRAGQLALFRPAQSFTDYHFEFFGEIERKSMSWAIRARDPQNYYAMKMTVIEPGLRPVVAVVHYPVVGGKKGHRIEVPLNVMMHNNEPYHVAVDVKGNRVVTSIEGQEVDSWSDDALKMGGVGFFADAGESAKLYWMRVTRNQDWLGRICAYLSNGSSTETADLWRGDIPSGPAQPSLPPPNGPDAALAAVETEEFSQSGPQRPRILKYGRTELCRS